jgi:hypothetical protein
MDLLSAAVTQPLRRSARRASKTMAAFAVIGVLAMTAYGTLILGIGLALSARYGPITASFVIAAATAAIALGMLFWMQRRGRRKKPVAPANVAAATVAAMVPGLIAASPIGSLVAVAAAAYVISKARNR